MPVRSSRWRRSRTGGPRGAPRRRRGGRPGVTGAPLPAGDGGRDGAGRARARRAVRPAAAPPRSSRRGPRAVAAAGLLAVLLARADRAGAGREGPLGAVAVEVGLPAVRLRLARLGSGTAHQHALRVPGAVLLHRLLASLGDLPHLLP